METETQSDASFVTRPVTIAGRSDIARIVYHDGHSISFPANAFPSIASVTSNSPSLSTAPSTLRSRSSSHQRRGRPRGRSGSSTSSFAFSVNSMPCISDGGFPEIDSQTTTLAGSTVKGALSTTDGLESFDDEDDWGTQTIRPDSFWDAELAMHSLGQDQDHLVANADGPHHDLPSHFTDVANILDDLVTRQSSHDSSQAQSEEACFDNFVGPQSAPPSSNWMQQAHRRKNSSASNVAPRAGRSKVIDLTPSATSRINRKPGRAIGSKLPEEKRRKVAVMRQVGACKYCKEGRRGCDPGTPCKPCILHFGSNVLDEPNHCRRDIVKSLCTQILSKVCKWHPYPRELTDFFGRDFYVTDWRYELPIQFGFGPYLRCSVQIIQTSQASHLQHTHVHYTSPLMQKPDRSTDFVMPVTFSDPTQLYMMIDKHLSTLVDEHFAQNFSNYNSRLQVLDKILKLYVHYQQQSREDYATLLHQALKLLVLVHNSEIVIPVGDHCVQHMLKHFAQGYMPGQRVTACVLRAELGKVIPQLARIILEDVLKRLLRICLARSCVQHPIVIATFSILMMTMESIMYHSSRIGYHAHATLPGPSTTTMAPDSNDDEKEQSNPFLSMANPIEAAAALEKLEAAAWDLQTIYRNCFENCHGLLLRNIDERDFSHLQKSFGGAPASFLAALNQAIREAAGYLEHRISDKVDGLKDSSLLFDRLLARLFLLQTGPY